MSDHDHLFFASPWIDRAAQLRERPERLARLRDSDAARYLLVRGERSLVEGREPPAARALRRAELPADLDDERVVFLGLEGERPWFAVGLEPDEDYAAPGEGRFADLRRESPLMASRDGGLLAYARAIVHWHSTHRYCGRCGGSTRPDKGGFLRRCLDHSCGRDHFPRTDPAVIVRVEHGDRIVLGRQPSWPAGWHSVLAGFVEPGESLEDAVRREVHEEVGVRVRDVAYFHSQPWPFPASLMVGYTATAESDELDLDGDELEDARWYGRDEIEAEVAAGRFRLPTVTSIARRLVDDWLGR